MPLLILCGIPCSGKSTVAQNLKTFFEETKQKKVLILSDQSFHLQRDQAYKDVVSEKNTRSTLKAAVERELNRDHLLILDSLNYIKGYRYELYCIARALSTPHSLVFCDTSLDTAIEWNKKRPQEEVYPESLLIDLAQRFERPNPKNRWDSPLFISFPGQSLPLDDIFHSLFTRQGARPNLATKPQIVSSTNYLHELDKQTQEIIRIILDTQRDSVIFKPQIRIPSSPIPIEVSGQVSISELKRLRAQFLKMSNLHPPPEEQIAQAFVSYLNSSLQQS